MGQATFLLPATVAACFKICVVVEPKAPGEVCRSTAFFSAKLDLIRPSAFGRLLPLTTDNNRLPAAKRQMRPTRVQQRQRARGWPMRPQNLYQAETVQMLGHGDPSVTLKRPILALYREMPGQGPVALTGQEVDAAMGGQVVECLWFAMPYRYSNAAHVTTVAIAIGRAIDVESGSSPIRNVKSIPSPTNSTARSVTPRIMLMPG